MTRERRPGQLASLVPGGGPGKGVGSFSHPAPPALRFSRTLIPARGEICLTCLCPIVAVGERITYATMTTHAHLGCAAAALKLLA